MRPPVHAAPLCWGAEGTVQTVGAARNLLRNPCLSQQLWGMRMFTRARGMRAASVRAGPCEPATREAFMSIRISSLPIPSYQRGTIIVSGG